MRAVVVGGGAVGEQVTRALAVAGHSVVVVEVDAARADELAAAGLAVTVGDACTPRALEAAGALRADVLVACVGRDEVNLVVSVLAKRLLDVPRVVARVNDEADRWLFDENWGVDASLSPASALVGLVEESAGTTSIVRLAELPSVGLALVSAVVHSSSPATGLRPAELGLARTDLVVSVVRDGHPLPVDGELRLRAGDRVLVVTDPNGASRVGRAFDLAVGEGTVGADAAAAPGGTTAGDGAAQAAHRPGRTGRRRGPDGDVRPF